MCIKPDSATPPTGDEKLYPTAPVCVKAIPENREEKG